MKCYLSSQVSLSAHIPNLVVHGGLVDKKLKDLHQKCTKEMDAYAGCMYQNTDEFELCRKEQKDFEKACPLN
ncbi:putative NADH dehydrogenase [ubiquinone] (complex I), alpha subcomplex, subunit 8 [Helianthus debilis subsp. tardiflorus]